MEAQFATRGTKFICSDQMTIADFQIYCEAANIQYLAAPDYFDAYPLVKAWYERCGQQKGIKEIHEGAAYLERVDFMSKAFTNKV